MRAVARQGPKKLAMSEIASEAGVSVGTLYRYFSSKDELLDRLGHHFEAKLQGVLEAEIAADPDPTKRLQIVIDVMLRFFLDNPVTMQLAQLEPGFMLGYVTNSKRTVSILLRGVLEPALAGSPAITGGVVTLDEVVDLIFRVAFSHYFMPGDSDYRKLRDVVVLLSISAGLEPGKTRGRAKRSVAS
ncbi:TetR/AcrR family transcriptional regulator [Mycolicibacterium sphagni]|nr:TetR/AcrR family transcriptional regulator [Mycolicibacterium sphagni]